MQVMNEEQRIHRSDIQELKTKLQLTDRNIDDLNKQQLNAIKSIEERFEERFETMTREIKSQSEKITSMTFRNFLIWNP